MLNDALRTQAAATARLLLTCYRDEHPTWASDSTPIDELVAWLGFGVETFHPDDRPGTFGMVDEEGDPIWLCRDLAETLRRFTLAHELGHAALHIDAAAQPAKLRRLLDIFDQTRYPGSAEDDDRCQQSDIQEGFSFNGGEDALQEQLGVGMTYNPRGERELIANIFAAELLMPVERVRALYLDQRVAPDTLAARFNVSHSALLNRLVGLTEEMLRGEMEASDDGNSHDEPSQPAAKTYDVYQQAAIEAPTPALIVAGPGSGKTSTLIGRVEYLIRRMDVAPEHILALTFSRKAAEEMQERLDHLLRDDDSRGGGSAPPASGALPMVSTFHAFCAETLRTYGERVGLRPDFTLVDEVEGYFLLRRQARRLRLTQYRDLLAPDSHFPSFLSAISRAKDELVTPAQYRELAQRMLGSARHDESEEAARKALEVADVYALYEEGLRQRQDTDFGGLIMLTVRLLEDFPGVLDEVQSNYQHILVDEFQDMNRASGVLLRLLAGETRRVWVVGDANQAIYRFRGASPANITRFEQDYPGAVVLPLSRNYRSLPDIVHVAETFRVRQLELGDEDAPNKNQPARLTLPGASVTLAVAPDNAAELAGLTADICARHARGYAYRDVAVLCRTRAQLRKVAGALAAAGLPVQAGTNHSLFGQEHVKDALAIVSLLAAPNGMGILRAAHQPDHAFTSSDLETLLLAVRTPHSSLGALIAYNEAPPGLSAPGRRALTRLSAIMQSLSVMAPNIWSLLAQYLFIETSIMRDLVAAPFMAADSFADHLSDYLALLNLARKYDQQQQALRDQQQRAVAAPFMVAEARGETLIIEPPKLQEQASGFLDYLRVLLSLGQDGGSLPIYRGGGGGSAPPADDEEQPDMIRVMTVHASKGLEFPVVYLPNLRHNSFPTISRKSPMPPPAGMSAAELDGDSSGEACLFYVGVTRARDQLVLSYSERNGKQKARASEFLDALLAGQPGEHVARMEWRGDSERTPVDEGEDEDGSDLLPLIITGPPDELQRGCANNHTAPFQPGAEFLNAVQSPTLHASALETYLRCPRQYFYGNICGFHGEERAYQLFWQATQQTLETLKQRMSEAGGISAEEAKALYSQHWQQAGGDALPFAALYEQHGHEIAAQLREKLLISGDTQWELRHTMTVEIAGRTIQLSIDRVEQPKGGNQPARFVRTRAAGKRKEKPTPGPREYLYAQAYKQHHSAQSLELYVHNLSTGETLPITFTPKREQKLYEELQESLSALERHEFPPKPDARLCPTCPFFFVCPA